MTEDEPDYEQMWQEEHVKRPGMAKRTFVTNVMFDLAGAISQLGFWVQQDDELRTEVFRSGCVSYARDAMIETTNADGTTSVRCDPTKPHPEVSIELRIVAKAEERNAECDHRRWDG